MPIPVMNVGSYYISFSVIIKLKIIMLIQGRFTLGVKAVKSWGQLNQYLSSFEARAGLK